MDATPARTAILMPSAPCACAATFRSSFVASSTIALSSSYVYCGTPRHRPRRARRRSRTS